MTQKSNPTLSPYKFPDLAGDLVFAAMVAQAEVFRAVCNSGAAFLSMTYLRQSEVETLLRPLVSALARCYHLEVLGYHCFHEYYVVDNSANFGIHYTRRVGGTVLDGLNDQELADLRAGKVRQLPFSTSRASGQ